jgi:electron-transferring-flavoprotein dehydrogenase
MAFDVVIVGAGPAGLSAAIRLKQIAAATGRELSVVVLEKGAEVGAHVLSGAIVDPAVLERLLPDLHRDPEAPLGVEVAEDRILVLGPKRAFPLPHLLMPRLMSNRGARIVSLGNVCRWLAARAEALGVEIYPGFAVTEALHDDAGRVIGVATGDMGIGRDGHRRPGFARGMALTAKYVLIAEGARGSLAAGIIARFRLDAGREPQKFGLGLKELWEVDAKRHRPGLVQHSFGWPLGTRTAGGAFVYHLEGGRVAVGMVVHLNYRDPHLSPFEELQRFKTHPAIRDVFEGGRRLAYGARAISEGGFQSVPRLSFPGGALIGCAAGLVNLPRIKGSHNAVASGIQAAEAIAAAIAAGRANDEPVEIETGWRESEIGVDLRKVRNVKPLWSRFGLLAGLPLGGLDMWTNELFGVSCFGTLGHGGTDAASLAPASRFAPIAYPKPDGRLTFDRLSSVFLSNTNHEEDQPIHLKIADPALLRSSELGRFGGPSTRYCPAGVYEWVEKDGRPEFVVNAQNCLHCKTCDIKDPDGNITWTPPEGGGGPIYSNM